MGQKILTSCFRNPRAVVLAVVAGLAILPTSAEAYNRTCLKKDAGAWAFGEAPGACNAASFGDVSVVNRVYSDLVLDRRGLTERERMDYVTKMHAVIRDLVGEYLRRRQPNVSEETVQSWVRALMSVATQETYLSHYRIGLDGQMKLMTGDAVKSHGIMQIHQGFHASRGRDNSFDLVGNVLYGLELFYANYQQAKTASCVKGSWANGVRSAYGIYNGGAGAICRWTKRKAKWGQNDRGYWDKYQTQPWKKYVTNSAAAAPINVKCLMNGDEVCANSETGTTPVPGRALILPDGKMCIMLKEKELACVISSRMFQCLEKYDDAIAASKPLRLATRPANTKISTAYDRDALCKMTVPSMISVGGFIQLNDDIRVRDQVDGAVIGLVKKGSVHQVLDYEIGKNKSERYYKIQFAKNKTGYIFGGSNEDHAKWATPSATPAPVVLIPHGGSVVEVVNAKGVTLRETPDDKAEITHKVQKGTQLTVVSVLIREATNELYLRVKFEGKDHFMYAGRTYPEVSVAKWVKVSK